MRVLVCGGRDYQDAVRVGLALDRLDIEVIIEGCARGADRLAEEYAASRGIPIRHHPADWDTHGRAAGPIRNAEMLTDRPDLVVAFPGGRGTANMILQAEQEGVDVWRV